MREVQRQSLDGSRMGSGGKAVGYSGARLWKAIDDLVGEEMGSPAGF